ncbi:MAG: (2Fe-2S)-binding protein [Bacteroidales bacterium]|nr:(2Fe-2S)-binding protein [Bacteroidales bacterium]
MPATSNPLVCLCASVTRKALVYAVKNKGATNLSEIRRLTGANTGCRKCTEKIEHIIETCQAENQQPRLF